MTKLPLAPWTVNRSITVIKDRWIDLRAEDCTTPAGVSISPYYVLRYPDWAHIVCLDSVDRICVISQYRHGAARTMMELPRRRRSRPAKTRSTPQSANCARKPEFAVPMAGLRNLPDQPGTHTNSVHVFACRVRFVESTAFDAAEDIRHEFLTL